VDSTDFKDGIRSAFGYRPAKEVDMQRNVYDETHAEALVPLLRSIMQEIQERTRAIARLERRREILNQSEGAYDRKNRLAEAEGRLSVHRREMRLATRELERLGCALDQDDPTRVRIPGRDGKLEQGFSWGPSDEPLQAA
jgi:hypothetical protein